MDNLKKSFFKKDILGQGLPMYIAQGDLKLTV